MIAYSQAATYPAAINKVPAITLGFWLIKVMTTTVGETVADFLAVNAGFGQPVTRTVMAVLLMIALTAQLRSRRCQPALYWLSVVLVSVVGTQITDALTDGLGVSLYASTAAFSVLLLAAFAFWYRTEGTLSINRVDTRRREVFYWTAILCTFALGTAAGDLATEALALGFRTGTLVFGGLIAVAALAYRFGASPVLSFWVAYILTRPLGAAMGDWLTQSPEYGGLGLGAMWTSVIFLSVITALVGLAYGQTPRLGERA